MQAAEPEHGEEVVRAPKVPQQPTAEEREQQEITNTPMRSWCGYCVKNKAKAAGHYLVVGFHAGVPVIQMDFT